MLLALSPQLLFLLLRPVRLILPLFTSNLLYRILPNFNMIIILLIANSRLFNYEAFRLPL